MLVTRRLSLGSTTVLTETLLRREVLADTVLARDALDAASIQIDRLLAQAQDDAQSLRDRALVEFWETANRFLQEIEDYRLTLHQGAVVSAEALLNLALGRLLDDTDQAERVRALVRHLTTGQTNDVMATLSCHPQSFQPLSEWLAQSRFAGHWQLKGDPDLAPETLRLSHTNGALDVDWPSLRRGLLTQCD